MPFDDFGGTNVCFADIGQDLPYHLRCRTAKLPCTSAEASTLIRQMTLGVSPKPFIRGR